MIPPLHLVTNDQVLVDSKFPERLRAAAMEGGTRVALHLRGPRTPVRELLRSAREIIPVLRESGARLLVNDRVDLALVVGACGAHLSRRSMPPAEARRVIGPDAILGCSVHGVGEAREVARSGEAPSHGGGADFVLAGTIFETPSHPGAVPGGAARIREVREILTSRPVLGIGGITPARVPELRHAGAAGVAVIRAVWGADDPAGAVRELLAALDRTPAETSA